MSSRPMLQTQSLLELLQQQHSMLDRLATLAQSQSVLIAEGRIDNLLDLLAQRQSLIDEFATAQAKLTEITQGLEESLSQVSGDERDRIKNLLNGIGERLTQVMQRDNEDQAALRCGQDRIKQELASTGAARQARNAYRTNSNPAKFADDRG